MTFADGREDLAAADAAVQHALLQRLLDDEAAGNVLDLAAYQAAFPGHDELVARTFAELGDRETTTCEGRERIGPYVLVRELGRGGQGTVYLARDSRLGRFVALKVLTGGRERLGAARIERFRREAEAASRIDHPAICSVLETGEVDGVFFLAMRNVPGESLALHIARAAAAGPQSTGLVLPMVASTQSGTRAGRARHDAVLTLIERVARALHIAHEAGIVHRDVKPGNVMVTPDGEPVVLDFGLARDLDDTGPQLTRTDEAFGTPAYMAPEQLRRSGVAVDRRTDVYALGVTLFECLTLRRPYGNAGIVELADAQQRQDVPDPRDLEPSIAGDLAVVVRCAMAIAPEHRYATTLDFADDLLRVRSLQPIRARPAGPLLRAWRWTQRNRVVAASMFVVVASLATALGFSLAANERVVRERQKALDEVAHREEVHDFLSWVLRSPSPLLIGQDTPLRTVFERAVEEVERRFADRPRTRGEMLALLGDTQISLSDHAEATRLLEAAVPLLRESGAEPQVLAMALVDLAMMRGQDRSQAKAAEALLHEARDVAVAAFGPDGEEALSVMHASVENLAMQRRYAEAEELARSLLAQRKGLRGLLRRRVQGELGDIAAQQGRWDEALAAFEAACAIAAVPGDQRDAFDRMHYRRKLCTTRARLGKPGDALAVSTELLAEMRVLLGPNNSSLGMALGFHGTLLRMLGRHEEAAGPYEESVAAFAANEKEPSEGHAVALGNLGALYRYLRRFDEALRLSNQAVTMLEALQPVGVGSLPGVLDNIADVHADQQRFPEALVAQARSLDLLRQLHGDGHFETVCAFHRTARLEALSDRFEDAVEHCELAMEHSHRLGKGGRVRVLRFANEVAFALLGKQQAVLAVPIARDSLEQADEVAPEDIGARVRFTSDLAVCLQEAGEVDASRVRFLAARELLATMPAPPSDVADRLSQRIEAFTRKTGLVVEPPK